MEQKELQQQLDSLKAALLTGMDAKAKEQAEAALQSVKEQLKALDEKSKEVADLKAKMEKMESDGAKNQKALDDLIAKGKEPQTPSPIFKSFKTLLGEKLAEKKEALAKYKSGDAKGFAIEMKDVGIFGSSTHLTGDYFVSPTIVPGVTQQPYEEVHMRDMLPVGQTNSNVVRFVRDNGGEGGPTTVAEGASKPQMDRDLEILDAPVRKIATHMRVPEEMIDDIPYLQSFLSQIGIEEVMSVEDDQILYGDGSGQNLKGLFHADNSTLFNPGTSVVQDANEFDVIRAARKQIRNSKLGGPLRAVVSPDDFFNMTSQKDTTNNYLFLGGGNGIPLVNTGGSPTGINVGGVIIEEHTAVNSGDFLVFQTRSAQIFDRSGTTVRFYDQDQDNAIKNLITIVIEKRLALAVYRPLGIIRGTFLAGVNDLANASE